MVFADEPGDVGGWILAAIGTATAVVLALSALLAAVAVLQAKIKVLWKRDDVTDLRVDQLWEAHLRRGRVEANRKRLIINNQDDTMATTVSPDARDAYEPIAPALRAIRQANPTLADAQLAEVIERTKFGKVKLGDWLSKFICSVLDVSNFACLDMAVMVAKETEPQVAPPPGAQI